MLSWYCRTALPSPGQLAPKWFGFPVSRRTASPLATSSCRISIPMRGDEYFYKGEYVFATAHQILTQRFPELQVVIITAGGQTNAAYPYPCLRKEAGDDHQMARIYARRTSLSTPRSLRVLGYPLWRGWPAVRRVVVTDCGGVREYARHLQNCLLVQPDNPHALASSIAALLSDPATRQILIQGGLHTAKEWPWQRTYEEIEAILDEVLGHKQKNRWWERLLHI